MNANETMELHPGVSIPEIDKKKAEEKRYLTRGVLAQMHLMPTADPVAYSTASDGKIIYYFDPRHVVEAPIETWYFPNAKKETMTLESGTVRASFSAFSDARDVEHLVRTVLRLAGGRV